MNVLCDLGTGDADACVLFVDWFTVLLSVSVSVS